MSKKDRHVKIFSIYLLVLFFAICLFTPFVYLFDFQYLYSYRLSAFVVVIINLGVLLFLSIAEFASLKFDRTADIKTLFATILLLLTYLTSNDFIFLLNFVNVALPQALVVTMHIFHHLFMLGALIVFLMFFKNSYNLNIQWKIVLVFFGVFLIANILFNIFDIFYGLLAISIIECFVVLYFIYTYKSLLNNKYNNYAGIVTLLILFVIVLSSIFELFYLRERSFLGINALFYFLISTCYISIYLDYFIKKTLSYYSFEDEKNKEIENKSHVMMVSCFHCFGCTYDGKQVDFPSKKAKELFALLVILRGKPLSIEKAITYLWPDKDVEKSKILYRNAVMKLRQCFKEINCSCLSFKRGEIRLDITNIICDYYDAEDGKKSFIDAPLLPEYEWSLEFENILK